MRYVYDYIIASMLFLAITLFYYCKQRKTPGMQNRVYGLMLWGGFITLIFDLLAGLPPEINANIPIWLLSIFNVGLLSLVQLLLGLFLLYSMLLTGLYNRGSISQKLLFALPLVFTIICIFISPFTKLIFYINEKHLYSYGDYYIIIYVSAVFYIVAACICVMLRWRSIQKVKRNTLFFFVAVLCVAMAVQLALPKYLLNTTAIALALTMMYHSLQSPSEHIDQDTGHLNRSALDIVTNDIFEQRQKFTCLLIYLRDYRTVLSAVGIKTGAKLTAAIGDYISQAFKGEYIIRADSDTAVIISLSRDFTKEVDKLHLAAPSRWSADNMELQIGVSLATLKSGDYESAEEFITTLRSCTAFLRQPDAPEVFNADSFFKIKSRYNARVEDILRAKVEQDELDVYYQPIVDASGRTSSVEALARLHDRELGDIAPTLFIRLAEQNGLITRLGEQILTRAARFAASKTAASLNIISVGVNLSLVQCMQQDCADSLIAIIEKCGAKPSSIRFEVNETVATSRIPAVRRTIERLTDCGCGLTLDNYGSAFHNMESLTALPFDCVKVDRELFWSACADSRRQPLFAGVVGTLKELGVTVVAEGIETSSQSDMIDGIGADYRQGYKYGHPMSEAELVQALNKE